MKFKKGDIVIKIKASSPHDEFVGKAHMIIGYNKTLKDWLDFVEISKESAVEFYKKTGRSITALPPEYFKLLEIKLSDVTYL